MRQRFIIFTALGLLLLATATAFPSEFFSRKTVTVPRQDEIRDDIYIFANYGKVNGKVYGDLTAFCYDINSSGEIFGNVNLFAYRVGILGAVEKSARLFGNYVSIDGNIGHNVVCFGNEIGIGEKSIIARDLTAGGNKITVDGTVKGNVKIDGSSVIISGNIEGNADITTENLIIIPPAQISGYLHYTSPKEASIEPGANILGGLEWNLPKEGDKDEEKDQFTVFSLILRFVLFGMALITGLVMIFLFREHTRESVLQIENNFWVTLAIGCLSFIVFTAGALVLMILIVFIPIAIFLICLGLVLFYVGKIYLSILVGRKLLALLSHGRNHAIGWELLLGLIILSLLFLVPYLGCLVYIFAFLIGIGAAIGGYNALMRRFRSLVSGAAGNAPSAS